MQRRGIYRHYLPFVSFMLVAAVSSCDHKLTTAPPEQPPIEAEALPLTECTVNSTPFNATACQVTGTITPFYSGWYYWIGSFEWTSFPPGSTAATTIIRATFDKPLYSVSVTAFNATYAAPAMVAFDAAGNQLGSVTFDYGPSSPHQGLSRRIIVDTLVRIRRIELRPATSHPDQSFWRDLSFEVRTPPPPLSEKLTLTPSSLWLKPGQVASFTVTSDTRTPPTVKEWYWIPYANESPVRGAPMTSLANCGTGITCTFPMYEAGWIEVVGSNGTLGGRLVISGGATSYGGIFPCPADTELDEHVNNPTFRRDMADAAANLTNLEQGGWPYIDSSTSTFTLRRYVNTYVAIPVDTISPCISYWPLESQPIDPLPTAPFVRANVLLHTHPYAKNEIVPVSCGVPANTKALEGPSGGDYKAFKGFPTVGFIVQKAEAGKPIYLYRFNAPGDKANHSKRWALDSDANGKSSCWIADTKWKS